MNFKQLIMGASIAVSLCAWTTFAVVYKATEDFTILPATSVYATYYKDGSRLAINAGNTAYRNKWAAAEVEFDGTIGMYEFEITGLLEKDGETSYKIFVNGTQVGETVQNRRIHGTSTNDYTPQVHTVGSEMVMSGDVIRVESDVHSNGLVPEGSAFAWARGRWTQIELTATTAIEFGSQPATMARANVQKIADQPVRLFRPDGSSVGQFLFENGALKESSSLPSGMYLMQTNLGIRKISVSDIDR